MATALRRDAAEQPQGRREGSVEHLESLFRHFGRKDAPLLDSVFASFYLTNQFRGKRFEVKDIMSIPSGKRYFRFEHLSIPYLATVETLQAPDRDYIVLRLPNSGYSYASAAGQAFYRHHCPGWVELTSTMAMEFFPRLCQTVQGMFAGVAFNYNETHNRVDIMLSPNDDGTGLVVAFELGYPYTDLVPVPLPGLRC